MALVGLFLGGIIGGFFGYFILVVTDDRSTYGGFVVVYASILYAIIFAIIGGLRPKEMQPFIYPNFIMILILFVFYQLTHYHIDLSILYLLIVILLIIYKTKEVSKKIKPVFITVLITILPLYLIFHSHLRNEGVPNIHKMYFNIQGDKELLAKTHINIKYITYHDSVTYTVFRNGEKLKDNFYANQYEIYINYNDWLYANFLKEKNDTSDDSNKTLHLLREKSDIYLHYKENDEEKSIKLTPLETIPTEYKNYQTIGINEIQSNNRRRSFFDTIYSHFL